MKQDGQLQGQGTHAQGGRGNRGGWMNRGNMRGRGRGRGGFRNQPGNAGAKPKNTLKFDNDYDFEQANTEFEELRYIFFLQIYIAWSKQFISSEYEMTNVNTMQNQCYVSLKQHVFTLYMLCLRSASTYALFYHIKFYIYIYNI